MRPLLLAALLTALAAPSLAQEVVPEVTPPTEALPPVVSSTPTLEAVPIEPAVAEGAAQPGQERLTAALSTRTVSISSSFDGETLTLFGVAEADPNSGATHLDGTYNVVVVVVGPLQSRVARIATRNLGVWMNTEQVSFSQVPSFYHVQSSGRLSNIIDPEQLAAEAILPSAHLQQTEETDLEKRARFAAELERLMTEEGRFAVNEQGVSFLSSTAYTARVTLPHDIVTGPFLARTYLVKDRQIVARRTDSFIVRKVGFERFLGNAATQYPFLYGLVGVLLAVGTGWLGGVVFRR
ncbi:MAG: TIGR02186 family protein [Devosia sp.]